MEQMSLDPGALLVAVAPEAADRAAELRAPRFLDRMRAGAAVMWDLHGEDLFDVSMGWQSDTARGWAAFAVPRASGGWLRHLALALRFADDDHFAVREWAWLGIRPEVAAQPLSALAELAEHARDPSPKIRRFCSEVTRPRGVWSTHIALFKECPEHARALLDSLAPANERYVRDSVANWVNDAARTRPDWADEVCRAWEDDLGKSVAYLCRRARRGQTRRAANVIT